MKSPHTFGLVRPVDTEAEVDSEALHGAGESLGLRKRVDLELHHHEQRVDGKAD